MGRGLWIAVGLAVVKLALHVGTNGQYGYFRDELYILACGEHLDWGYPDHAPLVAVYGWVGRHLFGGSLGGIRLLPALAGAGKVLLTGLVALELGGGAFAVGLACLGVLAAPIYLGIDTLLSMNAFEPLFWMGCAYLALRAARRGNPKLWVWVGALAGLGMENKHSMVFFAASLGVGVAVTAQRRVLATRWFWAGAGLGLLLFLPNLVWQYRHDWATLELLRNVQRIHKNVELGPLEFVGQQLLIMGPAGALVWGVGLWWLLRRAGSEARFLGWTYLALLGMMIALKAKNYYLAPAYPMLFAAGGVWWEGRGRGAKAALVGAIAGLGAIAAPLVLPVLPPERYVEYQKALGIAPPKTEVHHAGPLPQHLGDMFGWPEMVETVAKIYHGLPPEERAKAAIWARNYGEAGAIDFFGPRHGLPKAISSHQGYYLWGPGEATGEVLILLQTNRKDAERYCASVEEAGRVGHPYGMAEEHYTVLVCRGLRAPLRGLWPKVKHWN